MQGFDFFEAGITGAAVRLDGPHGAKKIAQPCLGCVAVPGFDALEYARRFVQRSPVPVDRPWNPVLARSALTRR